MHFQYQDPTLRLISQFEIIKEHEILEGTYDYFTNTSVYMA